MSQRRGESGAVAIMVAVLALLLMSMAALSVDLGRTYVEKRDIQKSTDFSALAGGVEDNLPGTTNGSCSYGLKASATDQAVEDVADFLGDAPWSGGPTASSLTDCVLANGEVVYGSLTYSGGTATLAFDPAKMSVVSPPRTIEFGLARIMGFEKVDVQGQAMVMVGTPGAQATMPSYAISGCDWGPQTITDPAAGHTETFVPDLKYELDENSADLMEPSDTVFNPSPKNIDVNPSTTTVVTLKGSRFNDVTKVGFFREPEGSETDPPEPIVIPNADLNHIDNNTISFTLPAGSDTTAAPDRLDIVNSEAVWWLRVWAPASGTNPDQWSAIQTASGDLDTVPFRVGAAYLRCVGASNEGNYGTLILPRLDSSNNTVNGWLPRNLAENLQSPLSLHTYPGSPTTVGGPSTAPDFCDPADPRTVYSPTSGSITLKPKTNCVDTDTGLPANAVSAGLVEGLGSGANFVPGRLTKDPATCGGRPSRTVVLNSGTYSINDDALTCYLNAGLTIGQVATPTYTGGSAFSCDLFKSPRFFYQPVLQARPGSGGSLRYSIVDFRPAFLTDQEMTALGGSATTTADNGVLVENGAVTQVDVIFFNNNAIPMGCPNSFGPSLGGTTRQEVRLVD